MPVISGSGSCSAGPRMPVVLTPPRGTGAAVGRLVGRARVAEVRIALGESRPAGAVAPVRSKFPDHLFAGVEEQCSKT